MGGNRSQQDAIAEMARGHEVAGSRGGTEDWKGVGRSGPKSSPVFEDLRVFQRGDKLQRGSMQSLNRGRNGAFIETGFFDGCPDKETAVAAWD
jgi:hypothetical protein